MNEDIARALAVAFPGVTLTDAHFLPLPSGSGGTVLAFGADGGDWVIKKPKTADARELTCLKIASGAGVAPKVRHLDLETGILHRRAHHAAPRAGVTR